MAQDQNKLARDILVQRHVTIGVFGPPGVGKSTFVANLFLKVLAFNLGWGDGLEVKIGCLDLDLGTPTLRAILAGRGQTKRIQKKPWTLGMAFRGLMEFRKARTKTNILFVDLPGKMDNILHLFATSLDIGILMIPWEEKEEEKPWNEFLANAGLGRAALVFSLSKRSGEESMLIEYDNHKKFVIGKVVGFDRTIHKYDPFISYLSQIFLFDLLPNVLERHKAREKFLS